MTENRITTETIEACKRGERAAQKIVYETLAPLMFPVCMRFTGDSDSAGDLLQDGMIRVFTHINAYAGLGSFEGWVRRIVVNSCLEAIRKKDILKWTDSIDLVESIEDESVSALDSISADEIHRMISKLPDGFRTVFNLYVIEGFSHDEIATQLQISAVTSRTQLSRARLALQQMIRKNEK